MLRSRLRNILHLYAGICELFVNSGWRIINADVMRWYKWHKALIIYSLWIILSIGKVYIIGNRIPYHLEQGSRWYGRMFQMIWNDVPDDMERCSSLYFTADPSIKNAIVNQKMACWGMQIGWRFFCQWNAKVNRITNVVFFNVLNINVVCVDVGGVGWVGGLTNIQEEE